jgi:serine/threonine-protein kinase
MEGGARFCGICGHQLKEGQGGASLHAGAAKAPDLVATAMARPRPAEPARPPPAAAAPAPAVASRSAGDPYVGAVLNNRFRVESKLGEGGFGSVYSGVQIATGRKVAIKLLHPEMSRDGNLVARFQREGQVLCSLRDAHTITTYDFDQTGDGTLFIAMELLQGRSLHEVFHSQAPIDWRRMLKIVGQMCSSLAEAHKLGIVHRDLKPENIYLEPRPGDDEFVKILDFGIAKVIHGDTGIGGPKSVQLTATGQTLGTLEYMSPEQLMGKELDGRSDVYAIGVLTYELVTGRLPFPDAVGPAALIAAQLKKVPDPPSVANPRGGVPPAVDQLVLTMLEKDKAKRFQTVEELREACERILTGEATAARGSGVHPVSAVQRAVAPLPAAQAAGAVSAPEPARGAPAPATPRPAPEDTEIAAAVPTSRTWIWVAAALLAVAAIVGAAIAFR